MGCDIFTANDNSEDYKVQVITKILQPTNVKELHIT